MSARDVKNLPKRIDELADARLRRLGVDEQLIRAELAVTDTVRVGRDTDRSLTGQLVDFAKAIPYYLPVGGWDDSDLRLAEDRLAETHCLAGRSYADAINSRSCRSAIAAGEMGRSSRRTINA